jgi:hypothetical protein
MQSVLLLKQTLEATYDPGPLLLHGPNVRFNAAEQLFSQTGKGSRCDQFEIGINIAGHTELTTCFTRAQKGGLLVAATSYGYGKNKITLTADMSDEEIRKVLPENLKDWQGMLPKQLRKNSWMILRNRCFLELALQDGPRYFPFMSGPGLLLNKNEERC